MSSISKDLCIPVHAPLNKQDTEFQTYGCRQSNLFKSFQNGSVDDVKGFCAFCDLDELKKQDYILSPGRYVGIEEKEDDDVPFEEKMNRLTSELSRMFTLSYKLEDVIRKKCGAIGYEL